MTDEVAKKCCKDKISACPFIEPASSPSSNTDTSTLADSPASLNSSGSMLHVGSRLSVAIVIFVAVSCALFV